MKDFSLPRLVFVLWTLNYIVFSLFSYMWGNGRHPMMDFIVYSSIWVAVEMICLGFIEDMA